MIRRWNSNSKQFEVLDNNSSDIKNLIKVRQIKNLSIRIGSFSIIGTALCSMDYINTNNFTSGLGIALFTSITMGCAMNYAENYYKEKEYVKKLDNNKYI